MKEGRGNRKLWAEYWAKEGKGSAKSSEKDYKNTSIDRANKPFCGRILGVDPSLRGTGLAVIDIKNRDEMDLIFSQTVKIPAQELFSRCTYRIFTAISEAIERYRPKVCSVEQTIYVQNFQTAQIMGMARGAALAAIVSQNLEIFEYAPLRIKQAICGYGRASKEQISRMVQAILKIHIDVGFDETDAAAAAICCFFTERSLSKLISNET
jgi:crossover junction endodeoxyribonuclease RuvC